MSNEKCYDCRNCFVLYPVQAGHYNQRMPGNAPALEKGLRILEYILAANETVSLSRIAESVGYKVSEIQRMVEYLATNGYLVKTASGTYVPGARL
mgnify:FL=1